MERTQNTWNWNTSGLWWKTTEIPNKTFAMPNKVNRILKIDHCMAIVFKGSPCRKKVPFKRNTGVSGGVDKWNVPVQLWIWTITGTPSFHHISVTIPSKNIVKIYFYKASICLIGGEGGWNAIWTALFAGRVLLTRWNTLHLSLLNLKIS